MIDIGITKLALIGIVALVVVGPERLPKVARMAGTLFGRAQRYINDVKSQVGREIEMEELRKMQQDVSAAVNEAGNSIAGEMSDVEHALTSNVSASYEFSHYDIPSLESLQRKARNFRKKKLLRNAAVPGWYKQQNGGKTRVISAAARVARHRPLDVKASSSFF